MPNNNEQNHRPLAPDQNHRKETQFTIVESKRSEHNPRVIHQVVKGLHHVLGADAVAIPLIGQRNAGTDEPQSEQTESK